MSHVKLRGFISEIAQLVDKNLPEAHLLEQGAVSLSKLIAEDDWLPDAYAQPSPDRYQQFLLYADARQRFSVVSFVWGPGQQTPVHDHTVGPRRRIARRGSRTLVCTQRPPSACHIGRRPVARTGCSGGSITVHRRYPSREQRVRRPGVHQHSCVRREHRRHLATRLSSRRSAKTLRLRLHERHAPQPLEPLEGTT